MNNETRRLTRRITTLRLALDTLGKMWNPTCGSRPCDHPICLVPRIARNALIQDEEAANAK